MAQHQVKMTMPPRQVTKADVEFSVTRNGRKYGTLTVSKGAVVWFPRSTTYGYKIGWRKFNDIMMKEMRFERR